MPFYVHDLQRKKATHLSHNFFFLIFCIYSGAEDDEDFQFQTKSVTHLDFKKNKQLPQFISH